MSKEFCYHCRKAPDGSTKKYMFTDGMTYLNGRAQVYSVQLHDACVVALLHKEPYIKLSAANV
jgi:hypothetical protein